MKPSITPFLSLRWRGNLFYTINEDTLQLVIQSPRSIVVCASSLSRKNKKISRTCVSTYSRPSFFFFLKACRVKLETRMRIFEHAVVTSGTFLIADPSTDCGGSEEEQINETGQSSVTSLIDGVTPTNWNERIWRTSRRNYLTSAIVYLGYSGD